MTTSGVRESGRQCPAFDHPEHIDPRHRILGEFLVLRYCRQQNNVFSLTKMHPMTNSRVESPISKAKPRVSRGRKQGIDLKGGRMRPPIRIVLTGILVF